LKKLQNLFLERFGKGFRRLWLVKKQLAKAQLSENKKIYICGLGASVGYEQ
jgi:3-deoxy-D-manno-octulosonic acid (KDO) 8-phosphate synthase